MSLRCAGERLRGIFSHVREYPPYTPKRTQGALPLDPAIASEQLEELQCLPIALPIARRCRVSTARRFASAPTTRCRSAHLVEVEPNFRLPEHSTMRRALAMPHSAGSLPPNKRHSRLTIVRRGCERQRLAEASWRSHVHRTHTAQRVQPFKNKTRNVGGRGGLPSFFLLGV